MLNFSKLAKRIFGSSNDRYVRSLHPIVTRINALEDQISALSDEELHSQTQKFRDRLGAGESLDALLPEAFATVREAARRTLGQRHYDVQLIGGIVLHRGEIAEMRTGEGKTLVATLAAYLNALTGKGVHVVTVNDYLARRDAQWMGQVYGFLGMTTGVIIPNLGDDERRAAYQADITYATNNELGFDFLRDNMKYNREDLVQRPFSHAIVDEVDSILIDEARTPLIISGPTEDKSALYTSVDAIVIQLTPDDWEKDEKQKTIHLNEDGTEKAENLLRDAGLLVGENLYDIENTQVVHHLNQALRANAMFKRDIDYIVRDGKVVIIDEFTGRMMEGRRWSDGLHQAVESKEKVEIQPENQTLASITFQNYFRMYPKLSGMTGTAATEAGEFYDIYKINVVEIPTNVPVQRIDDDDQFYKNEKDKFSAIATTIKDSSERGQPVLVGTVSIEKSEMLSDYLKKQNVPHNILNARFHEQEAHIVAQAGRLGAVTIATNMAGRGTDIQLGGNAEARIALELDGIPDGPERDAGEKRIKEEVAKERTLVLEAGGLFVLGTERHESRRIDNQLRGRSGRQGDPGLSRFYLSLDDDLLRIFGQQNMLSRLMNSGLDDGEAMVHPWLSKAIETAQRKVEARNYDIRKQLLQYDDVMNDQRKVIYEQRDDVMDSETVGDVVQDMRTALISKLVLESCPLGVYPEQWDVNGLKESANEILGLDLPLDDWMQEDAIDQDIFIQRIEEKSAALIEEKRASLDPQAWISLEKGCLLQAIDHHWKEHLATLDSLRGVIHLRAYAQKNPVNEYKQEAFSLFERMLDNIRTDVVRIISTAQLTPPAEPLPEPDMTPRPSPNPAGLLDQDDSHILNIGPSSGMTPPASAATPEKTNIPPKGSRNAPCPCGSGKKYKHCHGKP